MMCISAKISAASASRVDKAASLSSSELSITVGGKLASTMGGMSCGGDVVEQRKSRQPTEWRKSKPGEQILRSGR